MKNSVEKSLNNLPLSCKNGGFIFTVAMCLYVLISFVGQAILSAVTDVNGCLYIAVCSLFSIISLLSVTIFYGAKKDSCFRLTRIIKPVKVENVCIALALALGMFFGLGFINSLIAKWITDLGLNAGGTQIPLDTFGQFLLFTFTLAILPAIVEELFFRGLLLECFKGVGVYLAIVVNALVFALYHCSVSQFVYQFIYGVMLGLLAIKSGSILPCVIAHFFNNFLVIILQYLKVEIDLFNPLFIIIGLVVTVVCFLLLVRNNRHEENSRNNRELLDFFVPVGTFGIIICVTLIVGALTV